MGQIVSGCHGQTADNRDASMIGIIIVLKYASIFPAVSVMFAYCYDPVNIILEEYFLFYRHKINLFMKAYRTRQQKIRRIEDLLKCVHYLVSHTYLFLDCQ